MTCSEPILRGGRDVTGRARPWWVVKNPRVLDRTPPTTICGHVMAGILFACLLAAGPAARGSLAASPPSATGAPSAGSAGQPAIGWPAPTASHAPVIAHANLVTLENPQRAAFVNHQVAVRVDPTTHALAAEDRILVQRA